MGENTFNNSIDYKQLFELQLSQANHTILCICLYDITKDVFCIPDIYAAKLGSLCGTYSPDQFYALSWFDSVDNIPIKQLLTNARLGKSCEPVNIKLKQQNILPYTISKIIPYLKTTNNIPEILYLTITTNSDTTNISQKYISELATINTFKSRSIRTFAYNLIQNTSVETKLDTTTQICTSINNHQTADQMLEKEWNYLTDIIEKTSFKSQFDRYYLLEQYTNGKSVIETNLTYRIDKINYSVRRTIQFTQDPLSNDIYAYVFIEDITDSEEFLKLVDKVVSSEFDFIARVDIPSNKCMVIEDYNDKKISSTNHSFVKVETFIQKYYSQLKNPEKPSTTFLKEVKKQIHEKKYYTGYFVTKENLHKKLTVLPFENLIRTYCVFYVDVTEMVNLQKKQQKTLHETMEIANQANYAKTVFLSAMNHDIRTPINAIIGMANIIKENTTDKKNIDTNLQIIKDSAIELLEITDTVLEMSRIDSGNIYQQQKQFNLDNLLHRCSQNIIPTAKSKNITIKISKNITHFNCIGTSEYISRFISIILNNAIKFSNENSEVLFTITEQKLDKQDFNLYLFKIRDYGCGISKKDISHIFEPFYRTGNAAKGGKKGAGLGLAIAKQYIQVMNGSINIESNLDKGTTVSVSLPLKDNTEKKENIDNNTNDLSNLHNKQVLIVEDNKINYIITKSLLEKKGMQCDWAENGLIAYEKFLSHEATFYNCILMDIQMPVMDGLEATKKIRASKHPCAKTIPIIALTANTYVEDVKLSKEAGMNAHLIKPIDSNILYSKLSIFLKL